MIYSVSQVLKYRTFNTIINFFLKELFIIHHFLLLIRIVLIIEATKSV